MDRTVLQDLTSQVLLECFSTQPGSSGPYYSIDRIQFESNLDARQGGKKKGVAAIEDKALTRLKCFMI